MVRSFIIESGLTELFKYQTYDLRVHDSTDTTRNRLAGQCLW
jgi:hypothetical protein